MDDSAGQIWSCRDRSLTLGSQALIMGVLNVTPDSFSDGGKFNDVDAAIRRGLDMIAEGADIIDVGGESSRPGASAITSEEECRRVLPVVEALAKQTRSVISVDTTKSSVAKAALDSGAHIINDISGLTGDRAMIELAREYKAGLVIMHMRGKPADMQDDPVYENVVSEVYGFLRAQVDAAVAAGIAPDTIVVDPGIGFGKTLEHNISLIRHLSDLNEVTGRPVLAGMSRKRFIGTITGRDVDDRLAGSLAAMSYAITRGASIIRVHDVKESCDVARMMAKLIPVKDA